MNHITGFFNSNIVADVTGDKFGIGKANEELNVGILDRVSSLALSLFAGGNLYGPEDEYESEADIYHQEQLVNLPENNPCEPIEVFSEEISDEVFIEKVIIDQENNEVLKRSNPYNWDPISGIVLPVDFIAENKVEANQDNKISPRYTYDPISGLAFPEGFVKNRALKKKNVSKVMADPNISKLQTEVLRVGFPNAGKVATGFTSLVEFTAGLFDSLMLFATCPQEVWPKEPVYPQAREVYSSCFVQKKIEGFKNQGLLWLNDKENFVQSKLRTNAVIRNKEWLVTKVVFAVIRFVDNIFRAIGVFFGLCNEAKTSLEEKLTIERKQLDDTFASNISSLTNKPLAEQIAGFKKINASYDKDVEVLEEKLASIKATNQALKNFVDHKFYSMQIAIKGKVFNFSKIAPSLINRFSDVFSGALIDHSFDFLRRNIFGLENQERMKKVLDTVQDHVAKNAADNLKIINDSYATYENKITNLKNWQIIEPLSEEEISEHLFKFRLERDREIFDKLKRHRAVPHLSEKETELMLRKNEILDYSKNPQFVSFLSDKMKSGDFTEAEKLKVIGTIKSSILTSEKNSTFSNAIKYLEEDAKNFVNNPTKHAEKLKSIADKKAIREANIQDLIEKYSDTLDELKTIKGLEEKFAAAEDKYLESIVTLIIDKVIFPADGMPSDLKILLAITGKANFFRDAIKNQLKNVVELLEHPGQLKQLMNQNLFGAQAFNNDFSGNVQASIDDLLTNRFATLLGTILQPKDAASLFIDRLDATHLNKYLFFTTIDAAINGIAASFGKKTQVNEKGMILFCD